MKPLIYIISILFVTNVFADDKPNIVILFTDDQGTLDTNAYGAKDLYTPHMDRLVKEGVKFTKAYAHTVCCPSRAMLLTGRYPQRSGIVQWTQGNRKVNRGTNLPKEEITLAEVLTASGYKTGLFGKWHLGAKKGYGPLDQGFEAFFGHLGGFIDNYKHAFLHGKGFHDLYDQDKEVFHEGKYFPELMTKRAVGFLEKNKNKPFFMMVSYNIPHYPEQHDKKFEERYKDYKMPRKSYARMVSTTDDQIGVILDKLDQLDLTDNTIVIFMSDNGHSEENNKGILYDDHVSGLPKGTYYLSYGGGGYTGKWRGSKKYFFEGGIRVPTIIRYPKKFKAGIVREQMVTACDMMPTILDLCSVKTPEGVKFDGQSIVPIVSENKPSHHDIFYWGWRGEGAVLDGEWKMIATRKTRALYNLNDEKPEMKDYSKEKHEVFSRLSELYDKWLKDTSRKN